MIIDKFKEKSLMTYLIKEELPVVDLVSFKDNELDMIHYYFKLENGNNYVYWKFSFSDANFDFNRVIEVLENYIEFYQYEIYSFSQSYLEFIYNQVRNKLRFEAKKDFFIPTRVLENLCNELHYSYENPEGFISDFESFDLSDLKINL